MAVVELVGGSIRIPGLTHDQDVVTQTDGIGIHGDGTDVDIGVVARGLEGGGAIEVPLWEVIDGFGSLVQGLENAKLVGSSSASHIDLDVSFCR